jgi:hypothetical protein
MSGALTILMDPQQELPSGPMVQVVLHEGQREFPFSDLALEGDNPATIADDTLKQRVERWLDLREGTLDRNYKVARPSTGNIMIQRVGVYGGACLVIIECLGCTEQHAVYSDNLICPSCDSIDVNVVADCEDTDGVRQPVVG